MGIITNMFKGGLAASTGGSSLAVGAVADGLMGVLNRFLPEDPAKAAQARTEVLQFLSNTDNVQAGINLVEAQSNSLFKSGGRPFLLWVCGVACACNWILIPLVGNALIIMGRPEVVLHPLGTDQMNIVLFGLLGLSGFRGIERLAGRV